MESVCRRLNHAEASVPQAIHHPNEMRRAYHALVFPVANQVSLFKSRRDSQHDASDVAVAAVQDLPTLGAYDWHIHAPSDTFDETGPFIGVHHPAHRRRGMKQDARHALSEGFEQKQYIII
jgi:hypothetical protein